MKPNDEQQSMLRNLFAAIDARDTAAFLGFLSEDARFRLGSAPPALGHAAIGEAVGAFFETVAGLSHDVTRSVAGENLLICEGEVTYRRHDDSTVTLPFVDVFELDAGRISDYRIYMDIGPLYAT